MWRLHSAGPAPQVKEAQLYAPKETATKTEAIAYTRNFRSRCLKGVRRMSFLDTTENVIKATL